jgi:WD40 repeat protein
MKNYLVIGLMLAVGSPAMAQAPREFKGHDGLIESIALSPDGKWLATASFDNTVKLWDYAGGKVLHTLKGHTNHVYAVAFSPDGKYLASGSEDKTIRIWDPKDGKFLREIKGHGDIVGTLVFSPDSKILASGSTDKSVRLWNPADGKEIKNLGSHKESVYGLAFSKNGQLLASCSKDTTIKLWDIKTMKETRSLPQPEAPKKVEAKKMEKKNAKKDAKNAKKDAKKKEEAKKEPPPAPKEFRDAVTAVAFAPDGQHLLSVGFDKYLRVWNLADGKEVKKIGPTPDDILGLAVSRDGKIATAGYGGHLYVWDIQSGKPSFTHALPRGTITYCVAFAPDGGALVTGHEKNFVLVTPLKGK